jgi:hypothetical protein
MYEISIVYPVTSQAIKTQDDSLNEVQCVEVLEYLQKTSNIEIGVSWMEILKAINICRMNWNLIQ